MLTYVEGNSLHPERGGASVFARYAFNELWSFIAGWAILLDYLIVMAIGARGRAALPGRVLGRARTTARSAIADLGGRDRLRGVDELPRRLGASGSGCVLRLSLVSLVVFAAIVVDRRRPAVRPLADHRLDRPGHAAGAGRPGVRDGDRHGGLHRHRGGVGPGGRASRCGRARAAPGGAGRAPASVLVLFVARVADRADGGAGGHGRHRRSAGAFVDAPVLGVVSAFEPGRAGRGVALRGRRRGRAGAGPGRERPDARHRPAGVLAGHQPPDPEPAVAAGRPPLDALRDDRAGRGDRLRPRRCRATSSSWPASSPSARCWRSRSPTCR